MRARTLLMALAGAIVACESDDAKLKRLESDRLTSCLLAQRDSAAVADLTSRLDAAGSGDSSYRVRLRGDTARARRLHEEYLQRLKAAGFDTLANNWQAGSRACDLATRDYNRFMK